MRYIFFPLLIPFFLLLVQLSSFIFGEYFNLEVNTFGLWLHIIAIGIYLATFKIITFGPNKHIVLAGHFSFLFSLFLWFEILSTLTRGFSIG